MSLLPILQGLVTSLALLSDYTVILDYWLWTPPPPPKVSKLPPSVITRRRWRSVLKTALAYAVLEPVWYWFLTRHAHNFLNWSMVAMQLHFCHAHVATLLLAIAGAKVMSAHQELCEPYESRSDDDRLISGEEPNEKLDEKQAEAQDRPALRVTRPGPHCPHPFPIYGRFALMLPVFTSAATNAALQVFARFLYTDESEKWLHRAVLGWCVVALSFPVGFVGSKVLAERVTSASSARKFFTRIPGDVAMRLATLLALLITRSYMRSMLALPLIATLTPDLELVADEGAHQAFKNVLGFVMDSKNATLGLTQSSLILAWTVGTMLAIVLATRYAKRVQRAG